jgi:hypothetical protein
VAATLFAQDDTPEGRQPLDGYRFRLAFMADVRQGASALHRDAAVLGPDRFAPRLLKHVLT